MKTVSFITFLFLSTWCIGQNGTIEATNGVIVGDNQSITTDGTIRYDGTDLEGRVNGTWKSMTAGEQTNITSGGFLNNASYNLDNANGWVPISTSFTIIKEHDNTVIELSLDSRVSATTIGPGFGIQFDLRIDGNQGDYFSLGSLLAVGPLSDYISMNSIFENLTAGTYTAQIYARAPNFNGMATGVVIDSGGWGARILAREY